MPTTVWIIISTSNPHIYLLDAAIRWIAPYDEVISPILVNPPAEPAVNILVIITWGQGVPGTRRRRPTSSRDSRRIGVYHPHFGVSLGVDAAALKVQSASDIHVSRSRTQNIHITSVCGSRVIDDHSV
jgi:hypothetical protein